MQEASLFTRIINGEIPSYKIYEDEYVYAFLDIHPVQPGHVLVVPKAQVKFVWDLGGREYKELMNNVQIIARHMRNKLGVPYVGEKIEGTDVPHAHVHLIPFTAAEQFNARPDMNAEPDHEALARMATRLAI